MAEKPEMNGPDPLKSWPRAFRAIAAKVNELCAWFRGMEAGPGITLTKTRSRTIIALNKTAQSQGAPNTEGDAISAVGADGKLNLVPKHSTWATPSAYPSALQTDTANAVVILDSGGLYVEVVSMSGATPVFQVNCGSVEFYTRADGKVVLSNGTNSLTLDPALITEDMGIREVNVCDGGVTKQMLVIGSAPY